MAQVIHVFDAYGTLFDVHGAVAGLRGEIGPEADRLSQLWRSKHLEYSWIHALAGKPVSFRKLLGRSLDFAAASCGGLGGDLRQRLLAAYDTLPAYPEAAEALLALRRKRSRLAILSNGDADMLDMAVRSAGLEERFDAILSAAEVGVFKPSGRVYRLAMTRFGAAREDIVLVSANRWDVAGAQAFGFRTVWVNRSGLPDEYPEMPAGNVIGDLSALPDLMGA